MKDRVLVWAVLGVLGVLGCDGASAEEQNTSGEPEETVTTTPLADLSNGACPDMSVSGETTSFLSADEERFVTVVSPSTLPAEDDLGVVFFFHGLMDPVSTPEPASYLADALRLQSVADALGMIIVLPQSPIWNRLGLEFYLWSVEEGTAGADLTLYDDLRTCVAEAFPVDLERVFAVGFSGGALFTTVVASERADTLAGIVEMSGGADLEVPLAQGTVAPYTTPAWTVPSLLISGGEQDVWPSPAFAMIDFVAGTDTLENNLVADDHFVVRCRHDQGHTVTLPQLDAMETWLTTHRYGEPSPFAADGLDASMAAWCEIASP